MRAVSAPQTIVRLQRGAHTGRNGLLSDREVAGGLDLSRQDQLADAILDGADQHHHPPERLLDIHHLV